MLVAASFAPQAKRASRSARCNVKVPGNSCDSGPEGLVSIEAEHFHSHTAQGGHSWTLMPPSSASSGETMEATPNNGTNNDTGYSTSSPRLDFHVQFVRTGTHHVWVRGLGRTSGDDSVHVGLDGQPLPSSDRIDGFASNWAWSQHTRDGVVATINVPTTGLHTLNVWMREDGFVIDKLLLTTSAAFIPSGTGPAKSPGRDGGGVTEPPPAAPTIGSFTATPASITVGGSSALAWTTTNVTSVAIDNGVGSGLPTTGSKVVSPAATTTYTLTATGSGGTATSTATVTVTEDPGPPPPPPPGSTEMPENFTVAFIGDQGSGSNADAVLRLIKAQGADMVLHQGDFDYSNNPTAWDNRITSILGADFPYFASIGNHDDSAWSGTNGYQAKLKACLSRIPDAQCSGDLGVKSACAYKGLFFILSGVAVMGSGHEG